MLLCVVVPTIAVTSQGLTLKIQSTPSAIHSSRTVVQENSLAGDADWLWRARRFGGPLRCTGFTVGEGGEPTELTAEYVHDLEGKKLKVRCGAPPDPLTGRGGVGVRYS